MWSGRFSERGVGGNVYTDRHHNVGGVRRGGECWRALKGSIIVQVGEGINVLYFTRGVLLGWRRLLARVKP